MAVALLLSALLAPGAAWLVRKGLPRTLAAAVVLLGGLVAVGGVLTLVVWLILRNGLWTRPDDGLTASNRRMDNAATVLTVGTGVGIMYLGLLAAMFVLAIAVMDAGYLETQLERPVSIWDYVHLAWLSSCLGAFAGALGSNFDDEDAVREATYTLRWHERRKMFDSYESGDADSAEQEEQAQLQSELMRWDDPDFVRQQARERINLVMPGERRYHIMGDLTETDVENVADEVSEDETEWTDALWESVVESAEE